MLKESTYISEFGQLSLLEQKGSSPLIVMLHGLQSNKHLFDQLAQHPIFQDRAVIIPDLPGFGKSQNFKQFDYTIEAFNSVIEELVARTECEQVVVIGHSLGGMIGTQLLSSKKLKVQALISLEGNLVLEDCGASKSVAGMSRQEFMQRYFPSLISELQDSSEPSAIFRLNALREVNLEAFFLCSQSIVNTARSKRLLKLLRESCAARLLLVGEKSSFCSREIGFEVPVELIKNASHFMLYDNPKQTIEKICSFLATLAQA